MHRNVESDFAKNPTRIDMSRSRFDRNCSIKTSFNVGQIVPFYIDEVLPGDTFKVQTSKVVRLQTMLTPPMDNMYLDTYYFFVPNRLVWDHWQEMNGENTQSAWIPAVEYSVPQITSPESGWDTGTVADYLGVPVGIDGLSVSALPFRAYAKIINDWFRDENLCDPLVVPTDDSNVVGVNTSNFVTDVAKGGMPYIAAKYHDYFTSALPSPQKGPDVLIPVAEAGNLPVIPMDEKVSDDLITRTYTSKMMNVDESSSSTGFAVIGFNQSTGEQARVTGSLGKSSPVINNLWAVSTGLASAATINQLRLAFQIQKLYERDARGGTRYIELLKSHFGVTSPDSRLQRSEYLGGNRRPINVNQVLQQSGTGAGSSTPQGTPTGISLTTDSNNDFIKSFVEHGFVIGVMVVRYDHTYQQGLERFWSRKDRFDYYWPVFANIGEQAILNKEIYAQGSSVVDDDGSVVDDQVFGYQEAWADYRYKPNRVSGEMRSTYAASLDKWHLGDYYESLPYLSEEWIREDKNNVDRVLAVTSVVSNQVFCDVFVKNQTTRAMPVRSIPGLIDHH